MKTSIKTTIRCTHRVAISNARLLSLQNGRVPFRYKDDADADADANRHKVMNLAAEEFIRRFLLHVLPKGFVRIRHYGLLASRNVATRLADCRRLLVGHDPPDAQSPEKTWVERIFEWFGLDVVHCPRCGAELQRGGLPDHATVIPSVDSWADLDSAVPIKDSS